MIHIDILEPDRVSTYTTPWSTTGKRHLKGLD
jgi:hypothetical protein